jgi:hypothetical protein
MAAQAARILGVEDSPEDEGDHDTFVLVTVAGPSERKIVKVPTNVPAGRLAQTFGDAVGVTVVARLSVRDGETIHAAQTLSEVGVRAGAVILVDEPGAPGLVSSGGGVPPDGNKQYWSKPPSVRANGRTGARTPAQWTLLGAAVVGIVVIAMLLGAIIFGSSSSSTAPNALATQAARAWLAGKPLAGAQLSTVPKNLGRSGGKLTGTLTPAGSTTSSGITSQQFIVAPTKGSAYGLTVVVYNGQLAYAPSITGLPFAEPGYRSVPQTGTIVNPTASKQAQAWASTTFGPKATSPVSSLGYGLNGPVKVLNEWRPAKGASFVARVQVPLSNTAASTPAAEAKAYAAAQLKAINTKLAGDEAAESSANAAAQAAVTASNTANPPNPLPLALAAAAAQQSATNAQNTLTTDQQTQKTDQAAVATAVKKQPSTPTTMVSVYDVAFNASGKPLAWVPADYLIGQK